MQWEYYFIGKTIPSSQIMILQAKITYFVNPEPLSRTGYSENVYIVLHTNTTHNYVLIKTEKVEETETLQ